MKPKKGGRQLVLLAPKINKNENYILIVVFLATNPILTVANEEDAKMALIPSGEFSVGQTTKLIYLDKFYIDKT